MAEPLCTPTDVSQTLGVEPYQGAELVQVQRLCQQVSGLIRQRRKRIDDWIAAGDIDPDVVVGVACQIVARVLTTISTGGVGIRSEQHPEYSYELTASAAAGLNLTQAELALLTPAAGRARPFSIQPR